MCVRVLAAAAMYVCVYCVYIIYIYGACSGGGVFGVHANPGGRYNMQFSQ